jgi:CRP-like cAMP-binding protein
MTSSESNMPGNNATVSATRPLDSIFRLMNAAKPLAEKVIFAEHPCLIDVPSDEIWLVENGLVAMYRDGGKQLLYICCAPLVFGLNSVFNMPLKNYTVQYMAPTVIHKLPTEKFVAALNQHNLWEDLARLTAFYFSLSIESNVRLVKKDSYSIVKSLILEYQHLPAIAKDKTSLSAYIIQKGLMSRSHVLRILSTLNKLGYITIVRGKLTKVDFLPASSVRIG